jgi:uncharacterized protein
VSGLRDGLTSVSGAVHSRPYVGLAVSVDAGFCAAAAPLFDAGEVEALSFTPELTRESESPVWLGAVLEAYAEAGRVTLHGVAMSPLTAWPHPAERADWLASMGAEARRYRAPHVSEHYGFCSAGDVRFSAPLPVPPSRTALARGRAALSELRSATGVRPGLENLALAFSAGDAGAHGAFLAAMIEEEPSAFLVLDLHNLLCQASTFGIAVDELLAGYPLPYVRELHVAGGRTARPFAALPPVRRDTHDTELADDVLQLVPRVLARCPHVHAVFLERLPNTLDAPSEQARFRRDYRALVEAAGGAPSARSEAPTPPGRAQGANEEAARGAASGAPGYTWLEDSDAELDALQRAMLHAFRTAQTAEIARARLLEMPALAPYRAWLLGADVRMLETARELTQRFSQIG